MSDTDEDRPSGTPILIGGGVLVLLGVVLYFAMAPRIAHVSGTVTLDGQPVAGARVAFLPAEEGLPQAPLTATSDEQGGYRLVPNTREGITPGKYKVAVTKMALKDGKVPVGEALQQASDKGLLRNVLPAHYADKATTKLDAELYSGSNTVNLELKLKP